MLISCVIDFCDSWVDHLPLIGFAYNNSYHSSISMVSFDALYCRGVGLVLGGLKLVKIGYLVLILFTKPWRR